MDSQQRSSSSLKIHGYNNSIIFIKMRKIRKFSVIENGFLLSAEEMRRINGGNTPGCKSDSCDAYIYEDNELVAHYSGNCGGGNDNGYAVCSCNTSGGSFPGGGECDDIH